MRVLGFFMNPDNALGRFTAKVWVIVSANLLFLLFSIPVVTAGASYTAMYHVMMREQRSRGGISPVREFLRGFKSNFKQATIAWLLSLAFYAFCGLDIYWCRRIGGIFSWIEICIWSMMGIGVVILLYLFPVIAAFSNTIRKLFQNAVYFMMKNIPTTVLVAVITLLPLCLAFLDRVNGPAYAFIYFFFGFGLTAWICSWLLLKPFSVYLGKSEKEEP